MASSSSTRPVLALCLSELFGQIENCSSDLFISSSVQIELALFNDHLFAWEPLIEGIIDERGTIQSPFTINCQTLQVYTYLSIQNTSFLFLGSSQ